MQGGLPLSLSPLLLDSFLLSCTCTQHSSPILPARRICRLDSLHTLLLVQRRIVNTPSARTMSNPLSYSPNRSHTRNSSLSWRHTLLLRSIASPSLIAEPNLTHNPPFHLTAYTQRSCKPFSALPLSCSRSSRDSLSTSSPFVFSLFLHENDQTEAAYPLSHASCTITLSLSLPLHNKIELLVSIFFSHFEPKIKALPQCVILSLIEQQPSSQPTML